MNDAPTRAILLAGNQEWAEARRLLPAGVSCTATVSRCGAIQGASRLATTAMRLCNVHLHPVLMLPNLTLSSRHHTHDTRLPSAMPKMWILWTWLILLPLLPLLTLLMLVRGRGNATYYSPQGREPPQWDGGKRMVVVVCMLSHNPHLPRFCRYRFRRRPSLRVPARQICNFMGCMELRPSSYRHPARRTLTCCASAGLR